MNASCAAEQQQQQQQCLAQAAHALQQADVLLLVTGAGFSADSGLAVYADVARIPAYLDRGLEYHDICQPHWLEEDPGLFYGFWGQCFNDYRNTEPHQGYGILRQWRDDANRRRGGRVARDLQRMVRRKMKTLLPHQLHSAYIDDDINNSDHSAESDDESNNPADTMITTTTAGAFYSFTSNVDAHFYDQFRAREIYECHGNIELWQCGKNCRDHCGDASGGIWRAPLEHRFVVNTETMVAPPTTIRTTTMARGAVVEAEKTTNGSSSSSSSTSNEDKKDDDPDDDGVPRVGHTTGLHQRTEPLRYMPAGRDTRGWCLAAEEGSNNWPSCGHCGSPARPAILMFGDPYWQYDRAQHTRWDLWREAVWELCEKRRSEVGAGDGDDEGTQLKVCIFEVGCGLNVPLCRWTSEDMVGTIRNKSGEATLVRINPDFPLVSDESIAENVISIKSRGLQAIKQINSLYCANTDYIR